MVPKSLNLDYWLSRSLRFYKNYKIINILCYSDLNLTILVPFDSSRWDDSNGTKIVKFGLLDLLQWFLKFKINLYYYYNNKKGICLYLFTSECVLVREINFKSKHWDK